MTTPTAAELDASIKETWIMVRQTPKSDPLYPEVYGHLCDLMDVQSKMYSKIKIGKYHISSIADGQVLVHLETGEGGTFQEKYLEAAIDAFFKQNF